MHHRSQYQSEQCKPVTEGTTTRTSKQEIILELLSTQKNTQAEEG